MQHHLAAGTTQKGSTQKDLGAQGGGLPESFQPADSLEFTQQAEEHQDAAEGGFGGKELLQTEVIGGEIVLQFSNAVLHVGALVVIAPDLFRPLRPVGDEEAKGIAGNL
jgi:hypothetical protein